MKWRLSAIVLLAAVLILACSSFQQGKIAKSSVKESENPGKTTESIRVSFFSRGEGINAPAREIFEKQLDKELKDEANLFEFKKSFWGREGETDYCITFNPKSTQKQKNKIKNWCKAFADSYDRIYVGENEPCKGQ
ncbi:MAG: hypothetical protein RLZZ46_358 [Bacteroidota bacterium]|jgi:hypothetical protein